MPRISTSLLRIAHAIDVFLPALLGPCRDLAAAQNELRWLRDHVERVAKARRAQGDELAKGALLRQLVKERASGKPLQYLLGTEYFGDLEIRCRPGVLIPRGDTAASIAHLAGLLRNARSLPSELRVLDLCTGTGCIPLLVEHELYPARKHVKLRALGVDLSDRALKLAAYNLKRMRRRAQYETHSNAVQFLQADVLADPFADQREGIYSLKAAFNWERQPPFWDILISNPPYVSPTAYWKTATRSVRGFEPKLALVPPPIATLTDTEQGDRFYPRLLEVAREVEAKVVLFEVADMEQALRVAIRARDLDIFDGVEIWREQPDMSADSTSNEQGFSLVGRGNARSVLCWRGVGASWLSKAASTVSPEEDAERLFQSSFEAQAVVEPYKRTGLMRASFDLEASAPFVDETKLPLNAWGFRNARKS